MNGSKRPVIGIAVTLLVIIAAVLVVMGRGGDTAPAPEAAPTHREGCIPLNVSASSEKAALLKEVAQEYNSANRQVEGKCVDVIVESKASGAAATALAAGWDERVDGALPDVWSPAATSWLKVSQQQAVSNDNTPVVPDTAESIAQSPLVIAMPRPMAEALGWPEEPLGWSDLLALAQNPEGWGSVGHPEWGPFKLGKTNPTLSTSGLHATIGAYVAATGVSSDLTLSNLSDPVVQQYVAGVESSVVHYGDTTLTFLSNLLRADQEGRGLSYISAVTVEEKSVWDYNQGNPSGDPTTLGDQPKPKVPLVAIYPEEGTLVSDSPYAVLTGSWVTPEKQAAAADFLAYVRTDEVQSRFQEVGFRSFDGKVGSAAADPANGLTPEQPTTVLRPPAGEVLTQVVESWEDVRKKARALLIIDVSGSMGESVGAETKLDLAKRAALESLDQFSAEDQVGLWIFSTERDGTKPYLELVPVGAVGQNVEELESRISNLTPDGGTGLYSTARAGVQKMTEEFDPARINAVVLLTDGRNEFPADNDLEALVADLEQEGETSGVRLFTIGYGQDIDLDALQRMAEATNAKAYDASDPATIGRVFTDVISNF